MIGGLYEQRQFIIVPGFSNVTVANNTLPDGNVETLWFECNRGTKIHVFDTFDWEFKSEFDPDNQGPKVPPSIVKLVGGDETGGATLTQPEAGWGNPYLGPIFSIRNDFPPETRDWTIPTSSNPNNSVVIGGIVGGVCAVTLVFVVWKFFRKQWKSGQVESKAAEPEERDLGIELQEADCRLELEGRDLRAELQEADHRFELEGNRELHPPRPLQHPTCTSCQRTAGNQCRSILHPSETCMAGGSG